MKNKVTTIFKDTTFLFFVLLVASNLLSVWLNLPVWWIAQYAWIVKYGMILWACHATYILINKGNSLFLVTTIIGIMTAISYSVLP